MPFNPNFSSVDRLPPGDYFVKVQSYVSHQSGTGTKCVRWFFEVMRGSFTGQVLNAITPLEGLGACFLYKLLVILDPEYSGGEFGEQAYAGKQLWIRISESTPSGYCNMLPVAAADGVEENTSVAQ